MVPRTHSAPLTTPHFLPILLFTETNPHTIETFTLQFCLFGGCDLLSARWNGNGRPTTIRWRLSSIDEASFILCKHIVRRQRLYSITRSHRVVSQYLTLYSKRSNLSSQCTNYLAAIVAQIVAHKMKSKVISIVPRTYHNHLDKHLRSIFAQNASLDPLIENLEKAGFVFVGDLIKLHKEELLLYTESTKIISQITKRLGRMGLGLGMRAPGWVSPFYKGIRLPV